MAGENFEICMSQIDQNILLIVHHGWRKFLYFYVAFLYFPQLSSLGLGLGLWLGLGLGLYT